LSESRLFFFLFVLAGCGDEEQKFEPICQRRRIAAGRKNDESNDARFFFKFAVSLLMCVNSKAMMIKKYLASNFMKPEGVIDIKSTLSLRRRCTSFLSFEKRLADAMVFFNTHAEKILETCR